MKKEILGSVAAALNALGSINVRGRDNVHCMSDAFKILEGVAKYVSQLPDEDEDETAQ